MSDTTGTEQHVVLGFQLASMLKTGVDLARQQSHTITTGQVTSYSTGYDLSVNPKSKGYVEFRPKLAYWHINLSAYYPYPYKTHGSAVWSTNGMPVQFPVLTASGVADGEWKIGYETCP
ncbi:hypothetical protein ACIRU3_40855 [Streptomyces sp. NPDC101151]|uniref:hypothetical protein n=1 Tax=Streptomyces sp. NPDC101151 TaxID=3366115 RepID=UPI0037FB5037